MFFFFFEVLGFDCGCIFEVFYWNDFYVCNFFCVFEVREIDVVICGVKVRFIL